MHAIAIVPLVICLLGLLVYALAANPKVGELGRISFAMGLLVSLLAFATKTVSL